MAFSIETLTKDDDFFDDAQDAPWTVEGSGQQVYWKDCSVIVYNTDGEVVDRHKKCDGEGRVKRGTKLYFGEGKVKEV